uniref:CHK domain-containing protein n=1 Tax=Strongyloides venezuelensis TaxID=75913 RepID=A0A0K0FTS5_STRVS
MEISIKEKLILNKHSFTVGWACEVLEENDPDFKQFIEDGLVKNVVTRPIGKGKGCFANIYEIIFINKYDRGYNCVVKIPQFQKESCENVDENLKFFKNMDKTVIMMHNRECEFYNNFKNINIKIPKVFSAIPFIPNVQEGILLMKNLNECGAIQCITDSLIPSQMYQIMRYLARLHTYSIINSELFNDKNYSCIFNEMELESWYVPLKFKFKELFGDVIGEVYDEFIEIAIDAKFHHYIMNEAHLENGLCDVLIHGDVYTHNIFFRKDIFGNTTSELEAIFDWQTMQMGSPVFDVARCIVMSLDGDIRRRIEEDLLLFYYQKFSDELEKHKIETPFRYENFRKVYDITFLQQSGDLLSMIDIFVLRNTEIDKNGKYYKAVLDKVGMKLKHAIEDSVVIIRKYFSEWKY